MASSGIQRLGAHGRLAAAHQRAGDALWTALAAVVLVAIPAALAWLLHSALLFVSLGPMIYQLVERPLAPASTPRNTILGNGLALVVGYLALATFGLLDEPSSIEAGVSLARALAVVAAMAVTGALLGVLQTVHPPAGSTLLLVSLGIMKSPASLAVVFAGVVLVVAAAFVFNRLAHIPVPAWTVPDERS